MKQIWLSSITTNASAIAPSSWLNRTSVLRTVICCFTVVATLLVSVGFVHAQIDLEQQRLIDRDPFDQIILGPEDKNAVLEVLPLGLPDKIDYSQNGDLNFTWLKYPERKFKVAWKKIKQIRQFDEMVMDEAEQALRDGDFDRAFENFMYLYEKKSTLDVDEFRQRWDEFLAIDGLMSLQNGRYEEALSSFEELYRRNPTYPVGPESRSLPDLLAECYNNLVGGFVENFDYTTARLMLDDIRQAYGKTLESVTTRWENQMRQQALDILAEGKQHMANDNALDAHNAIRRTLNVMPSLQEGTQAFEELIQQYPMVIVGVSQQTKTADPVSIDDWSARRIGRLTQRRLMEYERPGDEGGEYSFPNGGFSRSDNESGANYKFQLSRRASRMGVPELSTYQLADRLMGLGDESSPDFYVPWQKIIGTVEIVDDTQVAIQMRVPFVKPEAHLQIPYQSISKTGGQVVSDGLYKKTGDAENVAVYSFNEEIYTRLPNWQHPVVVEKLYPSSSDAVDALLSGEIDVVDRIFPADTRRLRSHPEIAVANYILPTVHVLVPNQRNVFIKSNQFRRALLYAINRGNIVNQAISGGQDEIGYEVVTGPFPRGTDESDQIAYAYNMEIPARPYNLTLGTVLTELVRLQVEKLEQQKFDEEHIKRQEKGDENSKPEKAVVTLPKIVLAYADHEMARVSCKLIAQSWKSIGIETELKALPPGQLWPEDDDYDFVFTEITMHEPIADIRKVLGQDGWTKEISAPMQQELHNIDLAVNWRFANRSLKQLHKQINDDVTVIPLWQVVDKFAYRRNVAGIRRLPVFLYQNVDQWQILPREQETIPTQK
jgi:peptide/nickel transport system substrate-binding protein